MTNLRFVRVFVADHVPKHLIEQIKDRDYEIDNFYRYHNEMLMEKVGDGVALNPYNHIYVIADSDNKIVGFLWFTVDPLTNNMIVHAFSMEKEYWDSKSSIPMVKEFLREIKEKAKLKKVFWLTSRPKAYEKHGFKRSKCVLIEVDEE